MRYHSRATSSFSCKFPSNSSCVWKGLTSELQMFGLIGGLLNSLYRGHTFALPPIPKSDNGGLFPAPQTLRRYALRIGATEFFGVSNSVVGFARSEGGIDLLKSLKRVLVAGAPMPRDNGDWIVEHGVHLVEGVGSTEGGSLVGLLNSRKIHFYTDTIWAPL